MQPAGPFDGPGLFSSKPARVRFMPGQVGQGLVVRRVSFDEVVQAPALVEHVTSDTSWSSLPEQLPPGIDAKSLVRNTTLLVGPRVVGTIEHALGALAGLGIADATLEVEGVEVPILDGGAHEFVRALQQASQVHAQQAPGEDRSHGPAPLILREPVRVLDARGATIEAHPLMAGESPSATYHLAFDTHAASGVLARLPATFANQSCTFTCDASSEDRFAQSIAPARSFSFDHEARAAQALGLFRGFTPDDLLVLGPDGTPVAGSLRFPDEPARHKLLDLLGDLALLGRSLLARVVATRSGHALTHDLVRALRALP